MWLEQGQTLAQNRHLTLAGPDNILLWKDGLEYVLKSIFVSYVFMLCVSYLCFLVNEHGVSLRPSNHCWYIWSYAVLCFGLSGVCSQSIPGTNTHNSLHLTHDQLLVFIKRKKGITNKCYLKVLVKKLTNMLLCYGHFLITKIHLFNWINSRPLINSVQIDQIFIINLGTKDAFFFAKFL